MANPFDQCDAPTMPSTPSAPAPVNPFDQFDAKPAEPSMPAANPFDQFDPQHYANLSRDNTFDPVAATAQGVVDPETGFQVQKLRDSRPIGEKIGAGLSTLADPSTYVGAAKGIWNMVGGTMQVPWDVAAHAYYSATGDPRAATKQAEATLEAQNLEESVKRTGRAIMDLKPHTGAQDWTGQSGDYPVEDSKLQAQLDATANDARDREEFRQKVEAAKNSMQLAKGQPLDTGAVAALYGLAGQKPSEEVSPEVLANQGAPAVNQSAIDRASAIADPNNLLLGIAPELPGAQYLGGKIAQGAGKAAQIGGRGVDLAVASAKVLGKKMEEYPGSRALAGGVAALTGFTHAIPAAAIGGAGVGLKALQFLGKGIEQQGAATASGIPSALDTAAANARMTGQSAALANTQRVIGDAATRAASTAIGMAPANLALSEGDPEQFARSEVGAAAFGGAADLLHSSRPALVEAARPALRQKGLESQDTNTPEGRKSAQFIQGLPEAQQNTALELQGELAGLPVTNAQGEQVPSRMIVQSNADYQATLKKLGIQNVPQGGGQGFFWAPDGTAYINGEHSAFSDPQNASQLMGHEFAGHAAVNMLRAAGEKGGPIYDGMINSAKAELYQSDGKTPTPEFQRFIDGYNKAFDPTGAHQQIDASDPNSVEEFLAETAGRVISQKGAADIAVPKNILDKVTDGVGRFMSGFTGVDPRSVGTGGRFDRTEVAKLSKAVRDSLFQLAGMKLRPAEGETGAISRPQTPAEYVQELRETLAKPRPTDTADNVKAWLAEQARAQKDLSDFQGTNAGIPASGNAPTPPSAPAAPDDAAHRMAKSDAIDALTNKNGEFKMKPTEAKDLVEKAVAAIGKGDDADDIIEAAKAIKEGYAVAPGEFPKPGYTAQPEPAGKPPLENPIPPTTTTNAPLSVKDAMSGMGKGVADALYDTLFEKLSKGDLTEGGKPSRILQNAKPAFDQGLIKSAKDLKDFINAPPSSPVPAVPPVPAQEPAKQPVVATLPKPAQEPQAAPTREELRKIAKEAGDAAEEAVKAARTAKQKPHTLAPAIKEARDKAEFEAMAKAHAEALPADTDLVRWQTNRFGKSGVYGTRIDPSDPFHQELLERAGFGTQDKARLRQLQSKFGEPIGVEYLSAPDDPKAEGPKTKEQVAELRRRAQAEATAGARAAGEAPVRRAAKSFIPQSISFNRGANSFTVEGFSPDKFLSNASKVLPWLRAKGIDTYSSVNDPRLVEDLNGYAENHKNGWRGDGSAPVVPSVLTSVEATPGYEPHVIPKDRFDTLNALIGDQTATTVNEKGEPKGGSAEDRASRAEKQVMAKSNSPFLDPETGEVNRVRDLMKKEGDFTFETPKGEKFSGPKVLESASETIRPDLVEKIGPPDDAQDVHKLRPTGVEAKVIAAITGTPRSDFAAAGFSPSEGGEELTPDRLLVNIRNYGANRNSRGTAKDYREAIAANLRGGERSGGTGKEVGSANAQTAALIQWADANGAAISKRPPALDPASKNNQGEGEHDVFFDRPSQQWIKTTKPGRFGVVPSVENGKLILSKASPSQYIDRLSGIEKLFGIKTPIHGVIIDPAVFYGQAPSIVTSQPNIQGEAIPESEIELRMKKEGFLKTNDELSAYYRPKDNVAVVDAHPGNMKLVGDGKLVGYDSIVVEPDGELKSLFERDYAKAAARKPAPKTAGSFMDAARAQLNQDTPEAKAANFSPSEQTPPERALDRIRDRSKKYLSDNNISDLSGKPPPVNPDGTVTIYHRTTPEKAEALKQSGKFKSLENSDETYFSTKPDGQISGYGSTVVAVDVQPEKLQINDAFPDEIHFTVANKDLSKKNLRESPSFSPSEDSTNPEDGVSPGDKLAREAEAAGVVLKTADYKALMTMDPTTVARIRARIEQQTGKPARFQPDATPSSSPSANNDTRRTIPLASILAQQRKAKREAEEVQK